MSHPRGISFFGEAANQTYRRLFCSLYGVETPCAPLGEMLHWNAVARQTGLEALPLHANRAFVSSGYFYGIHAPNPSEAEMVQAEIEAKKAGADWVLYPLVRRADDDGTLARAGYERVPFFFEAEYAIEAGVDEDLAAQLGRKTAKNIARLARKAEAEFDLSLHWLRDATEKTRAALADFDGVHRENLKKYSHARNPHDATRLEIFEQSPLAKNLLVCVQREKITGACVQGSLNLASLDERYLMMLVQGIRREVVPAYHNLYLAETYHIYQWAEANGVRTFNLGRGGLLAKAMLGSNRFYQLDMHLKPLRSTASLADLTTLREATTAQLEKQKADVIEKLARGKFEFL